MIYRMTFIYLTGPKYLNTPTKYLKNPEILRSELYTDYHPEDGPFIFKTNQLIVRYNDSKFMIDLEFDEKNDNEANILFGRLNIKDINSLNYSNKVLEFELVNPLFVNTQRELFEYSENDGINNVIYTQYNTIPVWTSNQKRFKVHLSELGAKKFEKFLTKLDI